MPASTSATVERATFILLLATVALGEGCGTKDQPAGASAALDSPGLVAGYGFSEGTGTTTADASGNGFSGTLVSAPAWVTGKNATGLSFNGSSSYVTLGNPTALQFTGSMTVSAWVYETANVADDGQIVAKSNGSSGWQLKSTPDTGVRTFAVAVADSSGNPVHRHSRTVRALNTWYHVAGVYNAVARTLDIYLNGVLDNGALSGTVPASLRSSPDEREHRTPQRRLLHPRHPRRCPDLCARTRGDRDPGGHERSGGHGRGAGHHPSERHPHRSGECGDGLRHLGHRRRHRQRQRRRRRACSSCSTVRTWAPRTRPRRTR